MSHQDEIGKSDPENGEPAEQSAVDTAGEPEAADTAAPALAEAAHEAISADLTLETLNRYLAEAAADRDAAEERSAQVIARFSKLTIAVMCLTMVIAGANVAMIVRQSSAPQPVAVVPPQRVEIPTVLVQQPPQAVLPAPAPAPAPAEPLDPPRPAEKIPLLGSPPSTRVRQVPSPGPARLVRAPSPRPQPLLSARSVDNDSRESGIVERW